MSNPDERRIYARFMMTEGGQKFNAIIETLAIALFREYYNSNDFSSVHVWTSVSHDERQRWRRVAEGTEDFPEAPE